MSCREARSGADLDRRIAQLHAGQRHGQDRLVDEERQSSLAQYSIWPRFMVQVQPGGWTRYSSFHQRAVRTSSGSVRNVGS